MACSAVGSRTTTTNSFGRMITYVGSTTGTVHDDVSSPVNAILITYSGTAFEGFQGATKSLVTSSTTVPYQAHSVFDGANHTFTLDGTAGTPVAAAGVIPYPGDLCIGSQHIAASSANDWWDGMTAEFVVLTGGTYSSGDQATVRTDQKTYYGTP